MENFKNFGNFLQFLIGDWLHREKIQKLRVSRKTQLHFDQKSTIRTPEQASLALVSLLFRPSAMSSVGSFGQSPTYGK